MGHSGDDAFHKIQIQNENTLTESAENFNIGLIQNSL